MRTGLSLCWDDGCDWTFFYLCQLAASTSKNDAFNRILSQPNESYHQWKAKCFPRDLFCFKRFLYLNNCKSQLKVNQMKHIFFCIFWLGNIPILHVTFFFFFKLRVATLQNGDHSFSFFYQLLTSDDSIKILITSCIISKCHYMYLLLVAPCFLHADLVFILSTLKGWRPGKNHYSTHCKMRLNVLNSWQISLCWLVASVDCILDSKMHCTCQSRCSVK